MFRSRPTTELIKIASAGGGFKLWAASRPTEDLINIAAAAAYGQAQVTICGMGSRPTDDLISIAFAGRGFIKFEADRNEPQ